MTARKILPVALGAAVLALVAAIALSSKDGGSAKAPATGDLTVQRVERDAAGSDGREAANSLADLERTSDGRASVVTPGESARAVAAKGADSNVDAEGARILRVELRVPMGSPMDPDLRVVAWSDEELDDEDFDWTSETSRRRFRRRSSGAAAIETFAEARSADEVRWSVASMNADGTIDVAFDGDAKEGLIQIDGRFLYLTEAVEVDLASGVERVVLEPEIGAWITGTVRIGGAEVEPSDEGVFGTVSLSGGTMGRGRGRGMGRTDRRASLDETLAFEFRGVRPDMTLTLSADIPALAPGRSDALDLQPGVRTTYDLSLELGGSIEGQVLDQAGQPVPGATVRAAGQRGMMFGPGGGGREATSDATGAFRLTGLAEGSYSVTGSLEDWRGGRTEERIEVENASTRTGVVVRMTRGLEIAGRALLPDGSAAAGAVIRLEQANAGGEPQARRSPWGGGNGGPERKRVEAGPDGTFRFTALTETPARVAASFAPGGDESNIADALVAIVDGVTPNEPGEGDPIELKLEKTLTVSGVVGDDAGAPVTAFQVRASREGYRSNAGAGDGVRSEFTSEDGSFVLGGAKEGSWRVSIRAEGYDSPEDQTLTVVVPQEGAPLAFTLTRQGGVRGIVVDPSGAPVAGAVVRRATSGGGGFGGFGQRQRGGGTETDENGAFELAQLTPGVLRFEASSDRWADSEPITVEVEPGLVTEGAVLKLRQGGRITGVVNDASGGPWSGRRVSYAADGGPMAMFSGNETTTTDASGSFTFEHVPPGKWSVNASPDEKEMFATFRNARDESAFFDLMAQNLTKEVTVADGEEVFVQLGAEPREPVVVFGEVTRAGASVTGANVTFAREGADLFANLKRGDVEGGAYRLELDRPGAYIASVERGAKRNQFLVDVSSEGEQRIDLELPEGGIAGRIVDADGEPAVGVRVTAEARSSFTFTRFDPRSETTGGDGRYEILDLDPGTYTLRVGSQGWGRRGRAGSNSAYGRAIVDDVAVTSTAVTAGVDVRLSGAGRVIGTVADSSGNPVADATVFVREASGRPIDSISTVRTNAAGRFTYDRITPGTYVLSARTDAAAAEDVGGVVVREGEDTEVELAVSEASTLVINTVEEDDTPVRVQLSVTDSEGREVSGMAGADLFRTFGSGISTTEQRIGPLAPGRYTVLATAQDGRTEKKRVTVKGAKDTRVRMRFDPPKD